MTLPMTHGLPDPDLDHVFYDGVPAKRLFAWVVDVVIITAITFLLGLVTLSLLWWVWVPVYVATAFVYRAGTIASQSATLGMRLMNIELRGPTGARFSGGQAVAHTLGYLVCSGFVLLQVLSVGMIALGRRRQSLPDLMLGSTAINRPRN